jgi:ATP-binding cassette subfamily C protein CydD
MKFDKRLLRQTGNVRAYLGITVGLGLLGAILIILQAQFLSQIIDSVFLKNNNGGLTWPLLVLLGIILLRAGLAWGSEVSASRAAGRVKGRLREGLFSHLLKLGPNYVRGQRSGELSNLTGEGVETLDAYFSLYIPQVILTMLVPLIVMGVVFLADPLSGIVLAVTAPILPFFMILIGKKAESISQRQWGLLSQMSAHFLDVLQGLTTLKLFGRSQHQQETIRRISDRFGETTLKVLRVAFLSALVMELGATLSTAVIAVEVGLRLVHEQIPFQPAFFVLLLAPEFYLPFRSLGQRFHASTSAGAASGRIFDILDLPVKPPASSRQLPVAKCGIRFEQVSFGYETEGGKRPALNGVSFQIEPGEKVALTGPSGAGKSTIFQLLLRFIEPDEGGIYLDYRSGEKLALSEIAAKEWREKVAWVPQNPYLFNTSVIENIRLGRPDASLEEVVAAARQAHAHEFIEALPQGYQTVIGERGLRLSGGQAQRLSLARAFLKNAPLLLLDEATSNLDPQNEALVLEATARLMQDRTVLLIAHRPSTIARADRVIRLEAGQIVATLAERVVEQEEAA